MRYLLDANIISQIIRNPTGPAAIRLREVGHFSVCTSAIVSAEILFGLRKRGSSALTRRVSTTLSKIEIVPFEPPADAHYADIRAQLERAGTPISGNDHLIASQALAFDLTLVTDNVQAFSRVEGLQIENWLRDAEAR
jgi:tRNA(fMet)-specific endonuclease VapC